MQFWIHLVFIMTYVFKLVRSVFLEEINSPFGFTSDVYHTLLVPNNQLQQYVFPLMPHMGVSEPFGGNPPGSVKFNVESRNYEAGLFVLQTLKVGKFFFLQIYASNEISRKRSLHVLDISAVFNSEPSFGLSTITLRNTTRVFINVLDRNENCPFFTNTNYKFTVFTSASIYESVGRVHTTDADSGINAQAYYYLDPAADELPFRVDPYTGEIFPTKVLSRSSSPSFFDGVNPVDAVNRIINYEFKVFAAQRGDASQIRCNVVSVSSVHIEISQSNSAPPTIVVDSYNDISLPGIQGTAYALIRVVDNDSKPYSDHKLRIIEPDLREKFELVKTGNPSEWLLQLRQTLSSISLAARIILTLEASDGDSHTVQSITHPVSSKFALKSRYTLNLPVVSKSTYRIFLPDEVVIKISEASLVNCTIAVLVPNVSYVMSNSSFAFTGLTNDLSDESLNYPISLTSSGAVVLTKSVDVDVSNVDVSRDISQARIVVPFTVVDRNNLLLSSSSKSRLVIEIEDVNDNDPVVRNNGSVYEIREDAAFGAVIFRLDAFDPDRSKTKLSFMLYNSRSLPFILLDNGDLIVNQKLDAETMPDEFNLFVRVFDSGFPLPRSVLALFTVHLLDVNEFSPKFVELSCRASLYVNEAGLLPGFISTNLTHVVGRYSAEDADRDGHNALRIRLASSSLSRPCFNVNEQTGELILVCSYLASPDTDIYITLTASDGQRTSYSPFHLTIHLKLGHGDKFNVTQECQQSGVYEDIQKLQLRRKTYESSLALRAMPDLHVGNRHLPKFPSDLPTRLHVPENLPLGTIILQFTASDEDSADYSISGHVIYGIEAISSVPSESSRITSTADSSEVLHQAFILRPNYGDAGSTFHGTHATTYGVSLVVAASLDRESISSYSLILHACDLGDPPLCSFSPLHIFVEDLDDNPPEFLSNPTSVRDVPQEEYVATLSSNPDSHLFGVFDVPEGLSADSPIGQVTAIDADITDEIRYTLLTHTDVFRVHPKNGKIRLLRSLDREIQAQYELAIEARSQRRRQHQHRGSLSSHYTDLLRFALESSHVQYNLPTVTRVLIKVQDVNDNPPIFLSPGFFESPRTESSQQFSISHHFDGYQLHIPEDMPEGAYLTTLTARDADEGVNGLIGYSLFGNPSDVECFHVERFTGIVRLTLTCILSKFRGKSIHLTAWAFDHGSPQLTSNNSFIVYVVPVLINVFPPTFSVQPALFTGLIMENVQPGSPVLNAGGGLNPLRLEAMDLEGTPVSFLITGGSGMGLFFIDDRGVVRSTRVLDAESVPEEGGFWLAVYAVEHTSEQPFKVISTESNGPLRTLAEIFIEVGDENDNSPVPFAPQYFCQLSENTPPGVLVAVISATDADRTSAPLEYRISAGDPQGHFTINPKSGEVQTTARPLDREAVAKEFRTAQITLIITISDQGTPSQSCEVRVLVMVLDENDQTPTFLPLNSFDSQHFFPVNAPLYHFRVYEAEQDSLNGCVGRVYAADADDSLNGTVFYWRDTVLTNLVTADHIYSDGAFNVESSSGLVCSGTALPFGEYRIGVFAKDYGQPSHLANDNKPVSVHVTILPNPSTGDGKNELQFTFAPPKTHTLNGNQLPGRVLFEFGVTDRLEPDGFGLTFALTAVNGSLQIPFGLNRTSASTGLVFLAERLIRDVPIIYHLAITVSNGFGRLVAKTQIVYEPVVNNYPEFNVSEFSRTDSVAHATYTDFVSEPAAVGATGFRVQANVSESTAIGSLVCSVRAKARLDSNTFDYTIVSVGQAASRQCFALNHHSGELRVAQTLNHESIRQHYLLVVVRDATIPSLSSFIALHINVLDVNEHAPQFILPPFSPASTATGSASFTHPQYLFSTAGTNPIGTVVGRVTAFDLDSGLNGRVRYHIIGGDSAEFFDVDAITGDVQITKPLLSGYTNAQFSNNVVQERSGNLLGFEHHILVSASDAGMPAPKSNYTTVSVRLIPGPGGVDAPIPRFHPGVVHLSVTENGPSGHVIAPLSRFLMPDAGYYDFLRFELHSDAVGMIPFDRPAFLGHSSVTSHSGLFHVVPSSGLLVTQVCLDRELHGDVHQLVVRVTGSHGIRTEFSDFLSVEIHILDENDNSPTIVTPLTMFGQIAEDAPPESVVTLRCKPLSEGCDTTTSKPVRIRATDSDVGLNGRIAYKFIGPYASESTQAFTIDPTTGTLHLTPNANLDREVKPSYLLSVQVSDSGSPTLTADNLIRIKIEVLDVNDCPPVFSESLYVHTLVLPTYPSELIAQLSAIDPDVGDSVHYRIINDEIKNQFALDPNSGQLRVAENSTLLLLPARDAESTFVVEVEAYDSYRPKPHSSRCNVTVFVRLPHVHAMEQTSLIIQPENGLDVELTEHFSGPEPLRLGQFIVQNAPVGAIHRFVALTPILGILVDRFTGTIWATGDQAPTDLDRESTPDLTMHVMVRDRYNRIGHAVVRIHLLDLNDHIPLFIGLPYHSVLCLGSTSTIQSRPASESWCSPRGLKVTAVDNDFGLNGSITYNVMSIRPRADPQFLTVDAKSGHLSRIRPIPPDWCGRQLDVIVSASDGGGLSSSAPVIIHLVSDDGPKFSVAHYTASVSESAPVGEAVTSVEATSPSPSASLIYRIVTIKERHTGEAYKDNYQLNSIELADSPFLLEFNTGVIRLITSLDYETVSEYLLLLEVLDTSTGLPARVFLSINVTDANDVAPRFVVSGYDLFVSERHPVGHRVVQLEANDPDTGLGGQMTFSIEPHRLDANGPGNLQSEFNENPSLSFFHCDETTGVVTVARQLDFLVNSVHRFWAVATDRDLESLSSRIPITVHVLDDNDHTPVFQVSPDADYDTQCIYKVRLKEHSPSGTFVLRLLAVDLDVNDTLVYDLVYTETRHAEYFRLGSYDGILSWVPFRTHDGRIAARQPTSRGPSDEGVPVSWFTSDALTPMDVDVFQLQVQVSDGLHTAFCDVQVELEPTNWNAPSFPNPKFEVWNVTESTQQLGRIRPAEDRDRGVFGQLTYSLVGGRNQDQFRLSADTGDLYAVLPLDREIVSTYSLLIRATDGAGLFDHMSLTLRVVDVNDNRPRFAQSTYEITLFPESYNSIKSQFPLLLALTVKATDPDEGSNSELIYRIFHPSTAIYQNSTHKFLRLFDIDSRSGQLVMKSPLINRTEDTLQLFVEACDSPISGASETLCSLPAKISIHLSGSSNPDFVPSIVCKSSPIFEDDHAIDRDVGFCQVHPVNLSGTFLLTYTLRNSVWSASTFRIDSLSGHVYTTRPMDYDQGGWYDLGIEFHSSVLPTLIARTELRISLVDANDCSPEFDSAAYTIQLLESTSIGTRFLRVLAHDPDANYLDPVTYSLWPSSVLDADIASRVKHNVQRDRLRLQVLAETNPEVGLFRKQFRVSSDGWISLTASLDFETSQAHSFKVVAMDGVGHWNSVLVTVSVLDVNDNPPYWSPAGWPNDSKQRDLISDLLRPPQVLQGEVSVKENWIPSANSPIFQLRAIDPDLEATSTLVYYQLPEQDQPSQTPLSSSSFFTVSSSGEVRLLHSLDRELSASYSLKFQASDGMFSTKDTFSLRVNVEDVNDNVPVCVEPNRDISCREDIPIGTAITSLHAFDADADPKNSNVTYLFDSGDSVLFAVDALNGTVLLQGLLDFETKRSHSFSVKATDIDQYFCRFSVQLHVIDVNDNAPQFDPIAVGPVPEDAPIGSLVGKITARDKDLIDSNRLSYSLLSAHGASFGIDSHTGLLRVTRTLDRETKSIHTLTVLVTDGFRSTTVLSQQSQQFTSTASFTVRLLDVNDSPPQFVNSSAHKISISEMAPIGTHLTRLKAVSLDEGTNAVVRYRLLTKQPEFSLNETSGDVFLQDKLDHERVPSYFLTVEARDHGSPPLSATAVVTVTVDDENDNQPQFVGRKPIPSDLLLDNFTQSSADVRDLLEQYYFFSVVEHSRIGTGVGKLVAVDLDGGENGKLVYGFPYKSTSDWIFYVRRSQANLYDLLTPSEARLRFSLDSDTGQLNLLFEPDRELVHELWFEAVVSDRGSPTSLSNRTLVRIRFLDINDCPPVFEKSSYEFVVEVDRSGNVSQCYESQLSSASPSRDDCAVSTGGSVLVGHLKITDADADPNAGPFTCQLTHSGTAHSHSDTSRSGALFFVRNASADPTRDHSNLTTPGSSQHSGECLLYAADNLPVGSQSVVLRANDNGLTALHTSVTITIRVVRQANLPPEIVVGNATVTYYRGSQFITPGSSADLEDSVTGLMLARVTVKDRTAHDRLTFDLIPTAASSSSLFRVDRFDGTIRSIAPTTRSDSLASLGSASHTGTTIDDRRGVQPTPLLIPLNRLDSGLYPLRIRVTNGSLASEETLYIQVVAITDEMLEASTIVRISNLLPNLFYMENYDQRLRSHLARSLLSSPERTGSSSPSSDILSTNVVYIISVQESDPVLSSSASQSRRAPRSLDRAVDVLVAVYDTDRRQFVEPRDIASALMRIADSLDADFGGKVEVIHDICTAQFCPRGRCVTRVQLDPHGLVNRIEVHRVSQVSPRFTLTPTCQCPPNFVGFRCDDPVNGCSLVSCPVPRVCLPHGRDSYSCVCPPPRTGPNCESVQPIGQKDACYSELCVLDREFGPLQFLGGSFVHWELFSPNPYRIELSFALRTKQSIAPVAAVRWNSLRGFQIRMATGGRLVVSATGLRDGLPSADWLVSAEPLSDGLWHRVRLVLALASAENADYLESMLFRSFEGIMPSKNYQTSTEQRWWVELTVNGIHPRSTLIDWTMGDPIQQGIMFGADPVHGFGPLAPIFPISSAPVFGGSASMSRTTTNLTEETPVLLSGIVGCMRDLLVNQAKPPYQINHHATLTKSRFGRGPHEFSNLILMRSHRLTFGCDLSLTIAGPCASGPCLHGGSCSPGAQHGPLGSYSCNCPPLFHGHHCERTSDACLLKPCQNGGSCQALFGPSTINAPSNSGLAAYRCVCPNGVSGLHCEILHDSSAAANSEPSVLPFTDREDGPLCRSARLIVQGSSLRRPDHNIPWALKPPFRSMKISMQNSICLNNGLCVESFSGPICSCPFGWDGARCEHDVNECQLADTLFSRRNAYHTSDYVQSKLLESHGTGSGGLCSPFEVGRGFCVNTPGSYQCNCSLGFSGRHCQTKNLVPLTPDPNALGLTQFHIYLIVGLLAFLFLAALTAVILLACRARGFISSSIDEGDRTSKPTSSFFWPPRRGNRPARQSPESQFFRYNHSGGSSLAGVPFITPSPGHPLQRQSQLAGSYSSCQGFPSARIGNRRPSLASSTFALSGRMDDSTALLVGHMEGIKRDSNSSANATVTDYVERDDSSTPGTSRLLLYPTNGGDPVPVVMMMSPAMPYAGSVRSIGSRTSIIPRHSPVSAMFNVPSTPSGAVTPNNQVHSTRVGYNVEAPGSACLPTRQVHPTPQVAFFPVGPHHAFVPHPQMQYPMTQLHNMRPGSIVGSDRLSLGSGSDQFSAHGSQVLFQPNSSNVPFSGSQYLIHSHPTPSQVAQSTGVSDSVSQEVSYESNCISRPDNTGTLKPNVNLNDSDTGSIDCERDNSILPTHVKSQPPRSLPTNVQHHNHPAQLTNSAATPSVVWHIPSMATICPSVHHNPSLTCGTDQPSQPAFCHHVHNLRSQSNSHASVSSQCQPRQSCGPVTYMPYAITSSKQSAPSQSPLFINTHAGTMCHSHMPYLGTQVPIHLLQSCPLVYPVINNPIMQPDANLNVPAMKPSHGLPRYTNRNSTRSAGPHRALPGAAARRSARHCRSRQCGLPPLPSRPKSAHLFRTDANLVAIGVDCTDAVCTYSNEDLGPSLDGDVTPTLHKVTRSRFSEDPLSSQYDQTSGGNNFSVKSNAAPVVTGRTRAVNSAFHQPQKVVNQHSVDSLSCKQGIQVSVTEGALVSNGLEHPIHKMNEVTDTVYLSLSPDSQKQNGPPNDHVTSSDASGLEDTRDTETLRPRPPVASALADEHPGGDDHGSISQ